MPSWDGRERDGEFSNCLAKKAGEEAQGNERKAGGGGFAILGVPACPRQGQEWEGESMCGGVYFQSRAKVTEWRGEDLCPESGISFPEK